MGDEDFEALTVEEKREAWARFFEARPHWPNEPSGRSVALLTRDEVRAASRLPTEDEALDEAPTREESATPVVGLPSAYEGGDYLVAISIPGGMTDAEAEALVLKFDAHGVKSVREMARVTGAGPKPLYRAAQRLRRAGKLRTSVEETYGRVRAYWEANPKASNRMVARALGISETVVSRAKYNVSRAKQPHGMTGGM